MNHASRCLVLLVLIAAPAWAQDGEPAPEIKPLPESLEARFDHGIAGRLYLAAEADPADAWCDLRYRNSGGQRGVSMTYHHLAPDGAYTSGIEVETVPYLPTAVCVRAGRSDTIYVAGWYERGAVCVIERWELSLPLTVSSLVTPDGFEETFIDPPTITKRQIFTSANSTPIRDMVCQVFADDLWLLVGSDPRRIISLDLETGDLEELASSGDPGLAELADHSAMWAQMNASHGLVIQTERAPKWVPLTRYQIPYFVVVFEDADLDGVASDGQTLEYSQFHALYVNEGWDHRYEAPPE